MQILETIWKVIPWSDINSENWGSAFSLLFSSLPLWQAIVFMILFARLTDYLHYKKGIIKLPNVKPPLPPEPTPALDVGIVVPARNEEKRIHLCLRSILRSTGLWRLRIVAVNDRSSDGTKALMEDAAKESKTLATESNSNPFEVINIEELPADWIGKPHACWTGANKLKLWSGGPPEFILFTDGDTIFHERAIFEAALHMKRNDIDFLTAFPRPEFHSRTEGAFLSLFAMLINFFSKPWSMSQKRGKNHMGIGAFMMVRSSTYFKLGGHQTIKYNITEDLKLSLLFRGAGYKCAVALAQDRLSLRWGDGLVATWKGLLKNTFAAFDYSFIKTVLGCFGVLLIFLSPWIALLADQFTTILALVNLAILFFMHYALSKELGGSAISNFLLNPIMALCFCALSLFSAVKAIGDGGIQWRDRFYPLGQLKRQKLTVRKAFNQAKK